MKWRIRIAARESLTGTRAIGLNNNLRKTGYEGDNKLRELRAFLYRRFSPLFTCSLKIKGGCIELYNKYQIASFQDVFIDPNYWRAFGLLESEPSLIVDCGGHCGHFAILADQCIKAKFGRSNAHYVLIEPDPKMQKFLKRNLDAAGLQGRYEVVGGVVGQKSGNAQLGANEKNPLQSNIFEPKASRSQGVRVMEVPYVDIHQVVGGRRIDLLKLDVEGAEFEFFKHNDDVLEQTSSILIEMHANRGNVRGLHSLIESRGFEEYDQNIRSDGNLYCAFKRGNPEAAT